MTTKELSINVHVDSDGYSGFCFDAVPATFKRNTENGTVEGIDDGHLNELLIPVYEYLQAFVLDDDDDEEDE